MLENNRICFRTWHPGYLALCALSSQKTVTVAHLMSKVKLERRGRVDLPRCRALDTPTIQTDDQGTLILSSELDDEVNNFARANAVFVDLKRLADATSHISSQLINHRDSNAREGIHIHERVCRAIQVDPLADQLMWRKQTLFHHPQQISVGMRLHPMAAQHL
jgi:hypothetical protein